MNVALILVSLGIANAPEPVGHPLMVAYFEDMASSWMQLTRLSRRLLAYPDAPSTHGRSSSACQRRTLYFRSSFRSSTEHAMRKILRGYAKDRIGNLILVGTIPAKVERAAPIWEATRSP